jgi:hypothetical protein
MAASQLLPGRLPPPGHVPRVEGGANAGVKQVRVCWSRPQGHFTLLMESLVLVLAKSGMTVTEIAATLGERSPRGWGIVLHHVCEAHDLMTSRMCG